VKGDTNAKNSPYRYWLTGLAVELVTFFAYSICVIALVVLLLRIG